MKARNAILCVQTLRNNILMSSLMATTSITISVTIAAILREDFQDQEDITNTVRAAFIVGFFLASFIAFTQVRLPLVFTSCEQSMRILNHVVFLILAGVYGFCSYSSS